MVDDCRNYEQSDPSFIDVQRTVILAYRLSDLTKTVVHEASRASKTQINSSSLALSWALQNDQDQGAERGGPLASF